MIVLKTSHCCGSREAVSRSGKRRFTFRRLLSLAGGRAVPEGAGGRMPGGDSARCLRATWACPLGVLPGTAASLLLFRRDDDDINDVASMAGVNLSEESARILATNSELVGTLTRSCKDETFLLPAPLQRRILEIGALEPPASSGPGWGAHSVLCHLSPLGCAFRVVASAVLGWLKPAWTPPPAGLPGGCRCEKNRAGSEGLPWL